MYGSSVAYLLDETAEKDRTETGLLVDAARGVEVFGRVAGRRQRRLAWLLASRLIEAAIVNEMTLVIVTRPQVSSIELEGRVVIVL